MENASKALLIAGAILVCILLIGVGMLVYSSTTGTVDEVVSQMSSQEKQAFNDKFQRYAGNNKSGSQVRALIQEINANNATNKDVDGKTVHVSYTKAGDSDNPTAKLTADNVSAAGNGTTMKTLVSKINTARNYNVYCVDGDEDGLIESVYIYVKVSGT